MALKTYRTAKTIDSGIQLGESVWKLPSVIRGRIIEKMLGANLPGTFPTIDRFKDGIATSIKSIDLTASTYLDPKRLASKIEWYIEKLAAFSHAEMKDIKGGGKVIVIKTEDIKYRELILAVPKGKMTPAQKAVFEEAIRTGKERGVEVIIKEIP